MIRTQAAFIGSHDRLQALAALLDDAARFVGADHAALHEVDLHDPCSIVEVARSRAGSTPSLPEVRTSRLLDAVAGVVPVHCRSTDDRPLLILPLEHGGEVIGTLTLFHAERPFTENVGELLSPITALLAQLLEVWRITRRRREDQRSLDRLSQVARQMRNGMVITNADGVVDWVNDAFLGDFSTSAEQIIGRRARDIFRTLGVQGDLEAVGVQIEAGVPFTGEMRVSGPTDGDDAWFEVTASPFLNDAGVPEGLMIMTSDVTERRRVERMKQDFVSTVSHELRTPLTSIAGALSLLSGGVAGTLEPGAQEMLSIAQRNSRRLSRLIDDLLDLDKLAAGRLRIDLEPIEVMSLLEDACIEIRGYAEGFGVTVECPQVPHHVRVEVDPQRFQQVLRNLLSNAVKFSPRGSIVGIAVLASERQVEIGITDRGPGIPADFQDRIFERFTQVDSPVGHRMGTGLGLAIARDLVEHMGGSLSFVSAEGQGSTFTVSLPRTHGRAGA